MKNLFPTITAEDWRAAIARGRSATNAVSAQIRARVILQRSTPPCERAGMGEIGAAPRRFAAFISGAAGSGAGERSVGDGDGIRFAEAGGTGATIHHRDSDEITLPSAARKAAEKLAAPLGGREVSPIMI